MIFFFKQKTAYDFGTGDWSSDVCSSDLAPVDADGKTVGVGDVAAQTRQCIEVIKAALEQAEIGRASCRERV